MAIYEKIEVPMGGEMIKRINEDGSTSFIPINESNSDYQAYLNSDKMEHLTEIIPADEA